MKDKRYIPGMLPGGLKPVQGVYGYYHGGRNDTLTVPYSTMITLFGDPWMADGKGRRGTYPDDEDKTFVCWCVQTGNTLYGPRISFYNYCDGPNYPGGKPSVEELCVFSVNHTDNAADLWQVVKAVAQAHASGTIDHGILHGIPEKKASPAMQTLLDNERRSPNVGLKGSVRRKAPWDLLEL